jgi:hypothetical protein
MGTTSVWLASCFRLPADWGIHGDTSATMRSISALKLGAKRPTPETNTAIAFRPLQVISPHTRRYGSHAPISRGRFHAPNPTHLSGLIDETR